MRITDTKTFRLLVFLALAVMVGATTFQGDVAVGSLTSSGAISGTTGTFSAGVSAATLSAAGTISASGANEITAGGSLSGARVGTTGCPELASAATIAPTKGCNQITGSTEITTITTGSFTAGDFLVLIAAGTAQVTAGNDIAIGSNWAPADGDSLTMVFDGSDFVGIATKDNTP